MAKFRNDYKSWKCEYYILEKLYKELELKYNALKKSIENKEVNNESIQ